MQNPTRILVADPHTLFVEALGALLHRFPHATYTITAHVNTGTDVLRHVTKESFDLVILEMNLAGKESTQVIRELKQIQPDLPVLVLSMYDDPNLVLKSFKAGADGYLLKQSNEKDLFRALHDVLSGKRYMGPGVYLNRLQQKPESGMAEVQDKFRLKNSLTIREMEVLRLISQAMSNKEISRQLFISDQTVSVHRKNIMRKMGVNSTAGLIRMAFENQLI